MRFAICEAEKKKEQKRLSEAIEDWASAKRVQISISSYPSAEAFLIAWPDNAFDIIFLDIEMKNMTGIDFAEQIRKTDKNIMIVFVTSHKQYVLSGYDANALHYLIKPLTQTKLLPILDKAHTIWQSWQNAFMLVVSNDGGKQKLLYGDIFYISMSSHTAKIHTESGAFGIRKTAEELSEMLPDYFIRCHRFYIVNLLKVDCMYRRSLLLSNGETLPISRNSSKTANDAFIRFCTGS